MEILKYLGYLLILFAIIDFLGAAFGYDLTGVRWSPPVASIIGILLVKMGEDD
ncbi:hypothetical protein [uncultured Winogradskyella sp.]|uniref:hypothetical protein n=1 Tax=uncultured Winogradskyella sp. TaxID=395353 RepID=UPI00260C24DB|nr:hypothetical protein [uncultured Winogradskyella sp.]